MHRWSSLVVVLALIVLPVNLVLAGAAGNLGDKIQITRLDDLPQHTYPVTGQVSELVRSPEWIAELAQKVRVDVEADLAKYDIQDDTTLQGRYSSLLVCDLLEGKYDAALKRIEQIRMLEDKEAKKLTTGLSTQAFIAARRQDGTTADDEYRRAYRQHLAQAVQQLPYDVVEDVIQENKGRLEIFSENVIIGALAARLDPVVERTGELNADQASSVLGMHFMLTERLPVKAETIAVYQEFLNAHKTVKPDIWAERAVTLSAAKKHQPVLMAVWDSGTDPEVFRDRLWKNPGEKLNGQDDDQNGFVDDVHGPAYDIHAQRTTGCLSPLGDMASRLDDVMEHTKGLIDLQAALDTPEAVALKKHLAGLEPDQVRGFLEDLGLAGNYAHGTHVAGIMVEGNPAAQLLIARHSYDHRMIPVARTEDWGGRDGAKCRDTVEYFKKSGVRVVNMSWGEAQADAEQSLEANGIGQNADERREIARKVFAQQREGLYEGIRNAPDILFVAAAGNSDNDVEFDEDIPSSFDLPNLLIVGAVDQAGDPTDFTSFGKTVQVCANGFEVDSYVPGGQRMKFSGTSMASPAVANLAGKLLAMNPKLTPTDLVKLIKKTADRRTSGANSYLLVNPKRAIQMVGTTNVPARTKRDIGG